MSVCPFIINEERGSDKAHSACSKQLNSSLVFEHTGKQLLVHNIGHSMQYCVGNGRHWTAYQFNIQSKSQSTVQSMSPIHESSPFQSPGFTLTH